MSNKIDTSKISDEDLITIFEIANHAIILDCDNTLLDELDISDEEFERIHKLICKSLS